MFFLFLSSNSINLFEKIYDNDQLIGVNPFEIKNVFVLSIGLEREKAK